MTAFDDDHPPSLDLISDCVHCGFCLPTCPTYVLWGEEMDSPRGRIHLMEQGLRGEPLSASMVGHFDNCLGCMACVTACPSGVKYDRLIEDPDVLYITFDNVAVGRAEAEAILEAVPSGNYVLIKGDPGDPNASTFLPQGWDEAGLQAKRDSGEINVIAEQLEPLPLDAPVPVTLIRKIVKARAREVRTVARKR